MMPHEKLRIIGKAFGFEKVTKAQARTAAVQILDAADRLEVLEREHQEFFERWHDERRKREKLALDVERCYRMLLSEPDTKGALFKAENILREALADQKVGAGETAA